jgi:hypothetical protein
LLDSFRAFDEIEGPAGRQQGVIGTQYNSVWDHRQWSVTRPQIKPILVQHVVLGQNTYVGGPLNIGRVKF